MNSVFPHSPKAVFEQNRRFYQACLLVLIVCVLGFSGLTMESVTFNDRGPLNLAVTRWVHEWQSPGLDSVAIFVTELAGRDFTTLLNVLFVMAHTYRRQYATSITFVLMLSIGGWLIYTFKDLFQIPRPDLFPPILPEGGFSFPSGHSFRASYLYGSIAVALWSSLPAGKRFGVAFFPLLILGVMWSRIYLGVHFLTDVLAGSLIGIFCITIAVMLQDYYTYRKPQPTEQQPDKAAETAPLP